MALAFLGPAVLTQMEWCLPQLQHDPCTLLKATFYEVTAVQLLADLLLYQSPLQLPCRPELAEPQQQDQTHSKGEGHLFLGLQLLALHLQLAGMLPRGPVLGTHLQPLNGVVTGVLLRKERPGPLNKLAEQYPPQRSGVREAGGCLALWG